MSDKRRGLGRGLGALIPTAPPPDGAARPSDVFFPDGSRKPDASQPEPDGFTGNTPSDAGTSEPATARAGQTPAETDGSAATTTAGATSSSADGTDTTHAADPSPTGSVGAATGDATGKTADEKFDGQAAPGDAADPDEGSGLRAVPGAAFAELDVTEIRPNPRQPRTVFDEDELAELVHSISTIGVLQPIVVRPLDADAAAEAGVAYELIMGERRLRASREAGKQTIPAIVRSTNDDDMLRDALLENLHRAQLNPLEEAAAYQQLLDDFSCTHDELAGRIGRSRPQITNTMRLLKLPALVQRRVAAGVLSAGHARALLGLPDAAAMERLAQRIVAEGLSVRSTEEIVALGGDKEKVSRRRAGSAAAHPQLDDWAASLSDRLDTRVKIAMGKHRGKVTVEFAGVDDLNRIMDQLGVQRD
ncbi:ParB/RepB/Spo0J family partition protein [Flexivirga sp. ID2601S]|uniref:ParB/RepB/Spo0J family partition protein n=1 Tax=Flexivirga aerilata TaxID=1656889 RepID=A0A849AEV9_9MICO|nr:ParB/RepB/Spo0J family partition protein [Flexivirga aerilata]NNG38437.1 ParB/RepB/Spo0J family partition protein [Flexivirga aerilata]